MTPRLALRDVHKRFGQTVALQGVTVAFRAGAVTALVGENGAGKSTLMSVLAGAVAADAGSMMLDGAPYAPRGPLEARRQGVAIVHQELALAPHLTVEDNLFLGMEPARLGVADRATMRARARDVLAMVGRSDILPAARVSTLALAARQMVEIARALVHDARLVILDEPTSALAHDDVARLFRVIGDLRARGLAVIYISHVLEEVQAVADAITVMRDGRAVAQDLAPSTSAAEIVRLMVGRTVAELYPRSLRRPGEVVLAVNGLGGVRRPLEATFEVRRGEILGIAGLAGAGRTELLRAIFGLDPVVRGTVRVGASLGARLPAARLAEGVGFLSEDRGGEGLALGRSIGENLTLSRLPTGRGGFVSPGAIGSAARALIARLGIRCRGERQKVGELSGGNQQKVALGRLLHHGVDVLLLDEPTRGIDVGTKADVYALIDGLVASEGKAVVWVSSYLPELLGMADRIAVLRRGRLLPARPVGELSEHQVMADCVG
ncbi:MAG: sugar ABC transporter ATP-binding protein [Vicinamibacterales bacterium]